MPRKKQSTTAVTGTRRTSVDVLLAEDIPRLGKRGDLVRVKPGYARNYLIPQGLATVASEQNKRMIEAHRKRLQEMEAERRKRLKKLAHDLGKHSVTLEANANKDGHLYGSVLAADIAEALQKAGYEVQSEQVRIEGPLKELGMYTIRIELAPEITTDIKVWVVPTASSTEKSEKEKS